MADQEDSFVLQNRSELGEIMADAFPQMKEKNRKIIVVLEFETFGSLSAAEELAKLRIPAMLATEMHRAVQTVGYAITDGDSVQSHNGTVPVIDFV